MFDAKKLRASLRSTLLSHNLTPKETDHIFETVAEGVKKGYTGTAMRNFLKSDLQGVVREDRKVGFSFVALIELIVTLLPLLKKLFEKEQQKEQESVPA